MTATQLRKLRDWNNLPKMTQYFDTVSCVACVNELQTQCGSGLEKLFET